MTRAFTWSTHPRVRHRLASYGVPKAHIRPLLDAFNAENVISKHKDPQSADKDRLYTSQFFQWATDPSREQFLQSLVPSSTIDDMRRLRQTVDMRHPTEAYVVARNLRRKVIMHVGPTNSGKTHHALRALAAAKVGIYAGPLRLLAHEVWERLNTGQIVPAGLEDSNHRKGNPEHVRSCNLLTGDEQKIVDPHARLTSATVEMLSVHTHWDVGVIDEIQMIADPDRGYAWTDAVLGLCAKELHLCGEETAVPLIQQLMKQTGDELIVHRYQRLTPLVVQEESLDGQLSRVRSGDAVVTFSRQGIFALKEQVEALTGLRCAVAYGRLPPETRSEQAALFNDPDSGYDVMVGTDAIGMGLNLYESFSLLPFSNSLSLFHVNQKDQTDHIRNGTQIRRSDSTSPVRFSNETNSRKSRSVRPRLVIFPRSRHDSSPE
jgi:ATP-dependent RNA helicase SUPV3L1/SUV3